MNKTKSKTELTHYVCDCHSEVLIIDTSNYKEYGEIDFSMYQYYNTPKHTLWELLRQCRQILKTRHPYSDQISLNKEKAEQIIKILNDTIK